MLQSGTLATTPQGHPATNWKNKYPTSDTKIIGDIYKVKLASVVEGYPKAPFSIATTPRCREGTTPFPGLLHLTLETYLIMVRVKHIYIYIYIYISTSHGKHATT